MKTPKVIPDIRVYRSNEIDSDLYLLCAKVSCIPDEWRNAVITPTFRKGDRREPQNYRGISILNTCYKIYSKILNMKLQDFSEAFMKEP